MHTPTFFEGPEKKVELVVAEGHPSLREWGPSAWNAVVEAAGAQVLSTLRDEHCDAYLLSESSLFVYDRYLTMITCGRTKLVDAICFLLERIPPEAVALLIYERKNEHFPALQATTFFDDAHRLAELVPGNAFRFGDEHDHHVNIFCSEAPFVPDDQDTTVEILMHGLPDDAAARFIGCERPATGTIAAAQGITRILPNFTVDEHAFTPAGYSMNALAAGDYYTIHVTPEAIGSYVSFETNVDSRGTLQQLVGRVVEVFQPSSFDVVTFNPSGARLGEQIEPSGYRLKDHVQSQLAGYDVDFWHCYRPIVAPRQAVLLPV